jgi:hypothetical protein
MKFNGKKSGPVLNRTVLLIDINTDKGIFKCQVILTGRLLSIMTFVK